MEKHIIHCVDNKHSSKFCRNLEWENYIFKSGSHIAKSHIWKTIWKKNNTKDLPLEEDLPWVSGHLGSCLTFGPALRCVPSEGQPLHLSTCLDAALLEGGTLVSQGCPAPQSVLNPSATTRSCLACSSLTPLHSATSASLVTSQMCWEGPPLERLVFSQILPLPPRREVRV